MNAGRSMRKARLIELTMNRPDASVRNSLAGGHFADAPIGSRQSRRDKKADRDL